MARKNKNTPPAPPRSEVVRDEDALTYHEYTSLDKAQRLPGKLDVVSTKRCLTQRDLSLAYSPGVAAPSLAIARDPKKAADYTGRANLVAVVSNGTAVLGLGDIGPLAAKPVMEGKAVLFKRFAGINVFDIELNAPKPEDVIRACQMLEPTVGGINLEDIKAPDCFQIEEELRRTMKIPVFHDDQHGTAIIVAAAFINALMLTKRKIEKTRVVFSGAGAAAIACAEMLVDFGVIRSNIVLTDKNGVVHSDRTDLDPYKKRFAVDPRKFKARKLGEALVDADAFIGLSVAGLMTGAMAKAMAKNPFIFALANPDPEIPYHDAKAARPDALVASGRSDTPNQVNNVLGFPSIFRGALDVEATSITPEMKHAAARALAELARQEVPDSVSQVYGGTHFTFGPDYIIPKAFDPRVLLWVAPAVAEAAQQSGVARKKINIETYRESLALRMDRSRTIMSLTISRAKRKLRRIVFPEGQHPKIQKAASTLLDEGLVEPVLLGNPVEIRKQMAALNLQNVPQEIIDPERDPLALSFAKIFAKLRERKGVDAAEALKTMRRKTQFGMMMLREGHVDGLVCGVSKSYPEVIRPAFQIIKQRADYRYAAGLYVMILADRVLFFADTTVNVEPSAVALSEIALQAAEYAEFFGIPPRIALLSFSNFGSSPHPLNDRIVEALGLIRARRPDLIVDGEMQADTAVTAERLADFAFSELKEPANVLIFPNLAAGNIAYKLLQRLGTADVIGPILMGLQKPAHILQAGASVEEIVRMATLAAAEANREDRSPTHTLNQRRSSVRTR